MKSHIPDTLVYTLQVDYHTGWNTHSGISLFHHNVSQHFFQYFYILIQHQHPPNNSHYQKRRLFPAHLRSVCLRELWQNASSNKVSRNKNTTTVAISTAHALVRLSLRMTRGAGCLKLNDDQEERGLLQPRHSLHSLQSRCINCIVKSWQ